MTQTANQRVVREYVQRGHIQQADNAIPTTRNKLKVAAYARVSTDEAEQLNSYKTQCDYYTSYIQGKLEWEFVGLYADEGITGTSAKRRKEFQRLIRDAMDGKIDLILVKSVSRFARNTVDSLQTVRKLRDKGVKIYFEKENIDSLDAKCDMILSIYSSLAEEESRSISTNIRWAHQKKVERGEVVLNFNNIYGYQQDENKNVTIKIQEAEVVREIYHKYLIGYSIRRIIRELKENEIKSPLGSSKWSSSTIKGILENEKYIGDVILQKTYKRDFLTQRRVRNTGQAPQKYVENNHPAIVDKLTWNAVQAEIERRNSLRSTEATGKGRYDMRYAFSGVIECGECNSNFRRHNYTNGNKIERTWACKEHLKGNKYCTQEILKEELLEELFVNTLNRLLLNRDKVLKKVEASVKEAMLEVGTDNKQQIEKVDLMIEKLQADMLELNKRRGKREVDAEQYNTESREIMEQLDELFKQRDELIAEQSDGALSKSQHKMLTDFLKNEQKQTEFDKDVFTKLVDKVIVHSREEITFVFKDGMEIKGTKE
ncbi:MAG: recombinase family protein [Fastidiosipilaceae bacterium]